MSLDLNIWSLVYLALALLASGLSAVSWNRSLLLGCGVLLTSWALTTAIVVPRAPQDAYLFYFALDFVATEVIAFRFFRQGWRWQAVFLAALIGQLATHLWFWGYEPPSRRYHEILNALYWVQFFTLVAASRGRRPKPRAWLKPRVVYKRADPLPRWQPRTPPGQPGRCPTIVRAWA